MKIAVVLLLAAVAVAAAADTKYTTKYDNINLDDILQNDRLLSNYFKCIMDQGKCTADGLELKKHIPEALESDCEKCSEKQKKGSESVLKFLFEKKPELFKELEAKYDAEGKYRTKYQDRAAKAGVTV